MISARFRSLCGKLRVRVYESRACGGRTERFVYCVPKYVRKKKRKANRRANKNRHRSTFPLFVTLMTTSLSSLVTFLTTDELKRRARVTFWGSNNLLFLETRRVMLNKGLCNVRLVLTNASDHAS